MLLVYIYNLLNIVFFPLYILLFFIRIFKKKDNWKSLKERLGFFTKKRPQCPLIWLHAASVGESMIAITLVNAISNKHPGYQFLVTTATLSSANILDKSLPNNAIHHFVPLDNIFIVKKFLEYWQPSLGIFVESELWPCLVTSSAARFNILLVNARLSDNSYKNWQKMAWFFAFITDRFNKVLVQSDTDLEKYKHLGSKKAVKIGNLKFANKELKVDQEQLVVLKNKFNNKKLFVAASTHKEDEDVILKVIYKLKLENIDYFPIVILRHPERVEDVIAECNKMGMSVTSRKNDIFPDLNKDIFIVDTFGELGLFYSLAQIVFVGGSFKRGGHNLLEPAYFGKVILLGPDMSNFQNIADEMIKKEAAIQVKDINELEEKMKYFLSDQSTNIATKLSQNALGYVENKEKVIENYLKEIGESLK
ncbi:MAG: 3-deoxy-D-manno-octulosonic acid transferase [Rickettsiales bacterium]|nr:3-deoxy-D-manno-octulosonic acid transferase [Rickettsiales bacterium]MCA0254688.1 3-deoxy-D-manno-octulosonic acid transferase [Pseudomonadota bacterium]